jgi:hypothetical protein
MADPVSGAGWYHGLERAPVGGALAGAVHIATLDGGVALLKPLFALLEEVDRLCAGVRFLRDQG